MLSASLWAIFSGKIIYKFAFVALCGALQTLFSRMGSWRETAFAAPLSAKARRGGKALRVGKALHVCALIRRCAPPSPDRVKASAAVAKFPAQPQSLRACPLPLGGAVAQRLRGFRWRTEKKSLAKRLDFFRFDLLFGVTRGEQPLVRGSSASKSLVVFWFSFATKREHPRRRCILQKA